MLTRLSLAAKGAVVDVIGMPFNAIASENFPGMIEERLFARLTLHALEPLGFNAANSIACVGVCRDELCHSFEVAVVSEWGEAFNFSSLGGMLFLGTTGFDAAHAHAPVVDGKERYVYMSFTHIGIGDDGEQGYCLRPGRKAASVACGALVGLRNEMHSGKVNTQRSRDDLEQSLLKELLLSRFDWGDKPDLIRMTKVAREVAFDTLERMVELTVDAKLADYAIFSGVQVHMPQVKNYIWPTACYAVVDGARHELSIVDPGGD